MSYEARDYVTEGVNRLPDKGRKPNLVKYLTVYLQALIDEEEPVIELLNELSQWYRGTPKPDFILDLVGQFIGQPRPSGVTDAEYVFLLRARSVARVSMADQPSVERLVRLLSKGTDYRVIGYAPEHWYITFFDLDLTAQWQAIYADVILDAIGATDSLSLTFADGGTCLYDEGVYDSCGYA